MGDPRKQRKKYKTPGHPWEAERIKEESKLMKEYGLANKKELWKMAAFLRNWRRRARDIVGLRGEQRESEEKVLIGKLVKLGVLSAGSQLDDVLSLTIRDVLEKRLQTQVYKKGMAFSPKQARQFIVHNKVRVNKEKMDSPSYLVEVGDEIDFIPRFKFEAIKPEVEEKPAEGAPAEAVAEVKNE